MAQAATKESPWTQGEIATINQDNSQLQALVNAQSGAKPAKPAATPTPSVEPNPQFPPTPNPSSDLPDTKAATAGSSDTQAGILTPQAKTPGSTQTDINEILKPYLSELQQLGPEYSKEMEYLKPYLEQQPETLGQVESQSKADESPTGSKAVNEADQSINSTIENEKAPGFGGLADAMKQFEGTVPYSQILQTVLGAGKNEILYGTIPNISNVETSQWPDSLKQAYQFLTESATGTNAATGLPSPTTAASAQAANQQAANTAGGLYQLGSNTQAGGSTG